MSTGAKLKEFRGDKTQQEAAAGIGITKSALAMYERDERVPRDEVKIRIADYYGVSVLFLFLTEPSTISALIKRLQVRNKGRRIVWVDPKPAPASRR